MHDGLGFGNFVIATGKSDQLTLTTRGSQHLVDPFTVIGDQGIGRLQDRCSGAVVLLQLHHRARGFVRRAITEVLLKTHQDREIRRSEAVDALVGITHHEHRPAAPVVDTLRIPPVSHQQLDQLVLGAIGVLIFIHQHMPETTVPVAAHLLVLLQQLNRKQQQIIEIKGVISR